jgi:hypothetical protein
MSWSKVKKGKKPLKWWYHKVMAELFYFLADHIESFSLKYYYNHLNKCCKNGFNLYGEEWFGSTYKKKKP